MYRNKLLKLRLLFPSDVGNRARPILYSLFSSYSSYQNHQGEFKPDNFWPKIYRAEYQLIEYFKNNVLFINRKFIQILFVKKNLNMSTFLQKIILYVQNLTALRIANVKILKKIFFKNFETKQSKVNYNNLASFDNDNCLVINNILPALAKEFNRDELLLARSVHKFSYCKKSDEFCI